MECTVSSKFEHTAIDGCSIPSVEYLEIFIGNIFWIPSDFRSQMTSAYQPTWYIMRGCNRYAYCASVNSEERIY